MTISISLRPDEELELSERARQSGREVEEYIHDLIRKDLTGTGARETTGESSQSIDQILAPIREGFAQSGMTEEEVMAHFHEVREEVRRERPTRKGTP